MAEQEAAHYRIAEAALRARVFVVVQKIRKRHDQRSDGPAEDAYLWAADLIEAVLDG